MKAGNIEFFQIRKFSSLTPQVIKILAQMMQAYRKEIDAMRIDNDEATDILASYASMPNALLMLCFSHSEGIIGYGLAYWYFNGKRKQATILDSYILPEMRVKGIPRKGLEFLLSWARREGVETITVNLPRDYFKKSQGLVSLLHSMGFRQSQLLLDLTLDPVPTGEKEAIETHEQTE